MRSRRAPSASWPSTRALHPIVGDVRASHLGQHLLGLEAQELLRSFGQLVEAVRGRVVEEAGDPLTQVIEMLQHVPP